MKKLLYGVAYYDEYMPEDRLYKDIEMMKKANINVVRIAESTWSTMETENGVFNFESVDRVLDAMHSNEIQVIIGTPSYAVPTWLVKEHPDVLATTKAGKNQYGPRQNMNIGNASYLFYVERIIRELLKHIKDHPAIIGYQIDNETKHYHVSGDQILQRFIKFMKNRYQNLDALNSELGLDYWSNRINGWEDFPSVDYTINASLSGEFELFRRQMVTDFLKWQVEIVKEYKKKKQFITHNFDFDWRGHSFGIQPDVDHFEASKSLDIAGVDIYHPSQNELTGCEIAFCGDMARSLKGDNYFVIETQAQGHAGWLPYPRQLRLQAFSHLASGANMLSYWHWHSIHNSLETYWKGLLSHDFEENPTYHEATIIGGEFDRLSTHLINLKKKNQAAILVSNISLSSFNWFKMYWDMDYNSILRQMYDALYKLNVECDFIHPQTMDLKDYKLIIVPPLYAASDELLERLNQFVYQGGHVVYGIRTGFSNEKAKVRSSIQPGIINKSCGITYSQFTEAKDTSLTIKGEEKKYKLSGWIELLKPDKGETIGSYNHPYWSEYSAITSNQYGEGTATYFGCCPVEDVYSIIFKKISIKYNLIPAADNIEYPMIIRSGYNEMGEKVEYYLNYSSKEEKVLYKDLEGIELLSNTQVRRNEWIQLPPWGVKIILQTKQCYN